jgi:small subunit ribosomal protein S13
MKNLTLEQNLKQTYGINKQRISFICKNFGLNPKLKNNLLKKVEINKINKFLEQNYLSDNKLKQQIISNIKLLVTLKTYKGKRHLLNYPVRGQRTRDNAKTKKKFKYKK